MREKFYDMLAGLIAGLAWLCMLGCAPAICPIAFEPVAIPPVVAEPKVDDLDETLRVDVRVHCVWRA